MTAERGANRNRSSDSDNAVNIRSSSVLLRKNKNKNLNPNSMRIGRQSTSTSIAGILLFSIFIAVGSLSSVRSFSLLTHGAFHGKHHHQYYPQSSDYAFYYSSKTKASQQQQQRQALHTKLGATANAGDDEYEYDEIISVNENGIANSIAPTAGIASAAVTSQETNGAFSSTSTSGTTTILRGGSDDGYDGLGEYDPSENLPQSQRGVPNVGDPQLRVKEKDWSVTNILKELAAIQQQGPQKYCILGTRHCSYLHQQIIELLAYALVLSGNHVYTSGAPGTNAATVRGALRAEREDLLTVVLPQSFEKQTKESQELLEKVDDLITMPQNDDMSLDVASRICNSYLLSLTDQLVSFAFHESTTVIEANKEAKALDMLVTTLYLD